MAAGLFSGAPGLALGSGLYKGVAGLALNVAAFDPASLFAANEQGVWYDPSDLSTLYQDAAGTVPVTAAGQSVGLVLDKSGRGNHATQANTASKPLLQQDATGRYYLLFDGTDDFLVTNTITPGTDKAQVFAGVRKLSDAARGTLVELGAAPGTQTCRLEAPDGPALTRYFWNSSGSSSSSIVASGYAAPITNVLTGIGDIAADAAILRVNAAQAASLASDQGTGNYLAYPIYIGRRGGTSLPFNGRIYSLICRFGPNLTADQITQAETWMNAKTGAY